MARHAKIEKRATNPDPIYNNVFVTKLINYVMRDGKKTVAQAQVYGALKILADKGEDPLKVFERAVQNVGPKVEMKARRVGGANYQVPVEVKHERRMALALRWIIESSRKKANKEYHTFAEKLATELIDAGNNQGDAVRKRELTLKQADANKAFSSFRW